MGTPTPGLISALNHTALINTRDVLCTSVESYEKSHHMELQNHVQSVA